MQRRTFRLISVALVLAIALSVTAILLVGCVTPKKGNATKVSELTVDDDGYIRVLQLTDLHLTKGKSKKQDKETLRWVEEAIERSEPDIVAVTGDAVGGAYGRDKALIQLAEIFEEKQVYWMYTMGNHDGEWSTDTKKEVGLDGGETGNMELLDLLKGYEYSMLVKGECEVGVGNYLVNFTDKDDNVVHSFVNMDTRGKFSETGAKDYIPGLTAEEAASYKGKYMGLHAKQVEWYRNEMESLKGRGVDGGMPNSTIFMHVPIVEFRDAYAELPHIGDYPQWDLENDVYAPPYGVESNGKYITYPNVGMYDAIKEYQSTGLISVGHDHNFAWQRHYQADDSDRGVLFNYAHCSGVNAWDRRVEVGATVININTKATSLDTMYSFTFIRPTFAYGDWDGKTWK